MRSTKPRERLIVVSLSRWAEARVMPQPPGPHWTPTTSYAGWNQALCPPVFGLHKRSHPRPVPVRAPRNPPLQPSQPTVLYFSYFADRSARHPNTNQSILLSSSVLVYYVAIPSSSYTHFCHSIYDCSTYALGRPVRF